MLHTVHERSGIKRFDETKRKKEKEEIEQISKSDRACVHTCVRVVYVCA